MKYLLNSNTWTLHIKDCCTHSKGVVPDAKYYDTEADARKNNPRGFRFCKTCDEKREQILKEYFESEKG